MTKDISKLTPMEFYVTQEAGTEPPFNNEFWNNNEPGIYLDIISGEPLFTSIDKFDSGCGWPSFSKTIEKKCIKEKIDLSHNMKRIEVLSALSGTHLGHVFDDGPSELGGLRYCINSASLQFVHLDDLEKFGLEKYRILFEKS